MVQYSKFIYGSKFLEEENQSIGFGDFKQTNILTLFETPCINLTISINRQLYSIVVYRI